VVNLGVIGLLGLGPIEPGQFQARELARLEFPLLSVGLGLPGQEGDGKGRGEGDD
jgi:hypothetical protein